jgi:hypothetical protein
MVIDHREPLTVGSSPVNPPVRVAAIDLARGVTLAHDLLYVGSRQAPLAKAKLGVVGPDEALDGHGDRHPMRYRRLSRPRPRVGPGVQALLLPARRARRPGLVPRGRRRASARRRVPDRGPGAHGPRRARRRGAGTPTTSGSPSSAGRRPDGWFRAAASPDGQRSAAARRPCGRRGRGGVGRR